ncbi:MAG: Hpt domain-containing protein [bacterium]
MIDANSKPDYSTLLWVKEGLEGSILLARQSLEEYADSGFSGDGLDEFKKQLHQILGTLKMVQVHGAAMLVEELESVASIALEGQLQLDKRGAETLMLGLVQLPGYLESLESGHADIPLSLLPIINELRALRSARVASVISLYAPNLDQLIASEPVVPGSGNPEMARMVREKRNDFQLGLLSWYKGEDASLGLRAVHEVIQHINANAGTERLRRLMDSVEALIVVLEEGEFVAEGEVKSLVGRVDRFLKQLIDQGEEAAVTDFPIDLLKNVLYFVSRSISADPIVQSVKKSADLANTFKDVELQSESDVALGGASHEIVAAVQEALQDDLEQIKDAIDLFIRGGTTERDRVAELVDNLHQVADTLGMIGLGNQRTRINKISEEFAAADANLSEDQLLEIATEILRVEKALSRGNLEEDSSEEVQAQADTQENVQALISEAFTEFSQIKGNLEDYLRRERDPSLIDELVANIDKLVAVFQVVSLNNVADLLKGVGPHIETLKEQDTETPIDTEALVDVFAGIEYYLEMLIDNGANPEGVLEYSNKALERLDSGEMPTPEVEIEPEPEAATEEEEIVSLDDGLESAEPEFSDEPEFVEPATEDEALVLDEEIMDLDIDLSDLESADEEMAEVIEEQPDPEETVDDFGMIESVEIEEDQTAESEVSEVDDIILQLDEDVETEDDEALAEIEEAVDSVSETAEEEEPEIEEATEAPAAVESEAPVAAKAMDEVDPEIFDIFMEEAQEELEVIQTEYPKWAADIENREPLEAFRRSFHTLKGSGRMVGALTIGEFAWAIENLLNRVIDGRVQADSQLIGVMDSAVEVLPLLVEGQAKGVMPDVDIASIEELAFAIADGKVVAEETAADEVSEAEAVVAETEVEEVPEEVAVPEEEAASIEEAQVEEGEAEAPEAEVEPQEPAPIEIDAALLEIFGGESRSHLDNVKNCIERSSMDGYRVPEELVRAIHTLRGSSHLAEVEPMAELAAAMENYCNLQKKQPEIVEQPEFSEVLSEFHGTMEAILATINQSGAELPKWQPLVERIQNAIATLESITEAAAVETEVAEQPASAVTAVPLPEDIDIELLDIFLEEADELSESLENAVRGWEGDPESVDHLDSIKRTLHTLKGGARLASLSDTGDLVHNMESLFEGIAESHLNLDEDLQNVLRNAFDGLYTTIETLRQDHNLVDLTEVTSAMQGYLDQLPEAGELETAAFEAESEAIEMQDESLLADEVEVGVDGDYEEETESLLHTTEWAADTTTVYEEAADTTMMEPQGEKVEVDSELLEIFLEEAVEMAEQLETAYGDWVLDTSDREPVASLLRSLHTLKGGARLASLPTVGDLVHALESLFERFVDEENGLDVAPEMPGLVRNALDGIHGGLEQLQENRTLPSYEGLTAALNAAAAGEAWEALLEAAGETQPTESIISSKWEEQTDFDEDEEDSSFIMDSQLLTDSELLSDSQLQPSSVLLSAESKVLPFPGNQEITIKRPDKRPPPLQAEEESASAGERVRVRSELLDQLVNNAGEVSIFRARLEQQNNVVARHLEELGQTIGRLQNQVRSMEIETEAQILSTHEREYGGKEGYEDFDPLEMDRYSTLQQLSRALSETINDLGSIGETLEDQSRDTDTLLLQQQRVNNDLQDGLLRTRMVPFRRQASRLERVVRQTANSMQKRAELLVQGAEGEIDRTILNRIMGPLEHLLRNAVAHGIEMPAERRSAEKMETGKVSLILDREGSDISITISDDGRGLDVDAIKATAIERGMLDKDAEIEDDDVYQFILQPGFSTAEEVTQISGRGVGMDAVVNEIKLLGGSLEIESQAGRGSSFVIRLPFTLAITEALLVRVGEETYAIPHGAVEVIVRVTRQDLLECYNGTRESIEYGDHEYKVRYMGSMMGVMAPTLLEGHKWFPVLLVRAGEHRVAIQVDHLLGNNEIVVKSIGNQLAGVRWFTGGTILGDGGVALILDVNSLVRMDSSHHIELPAEEEDEIAGVTVMVVDDSITVRKVTSRLLERHNMDVITAKDGVDAVTVLQDQIPDIMLLDIEMPRMDGYELARHMRHTPELAQIPIIMITSRTGEKHRQRAMELGVKRYLGKPYQEADLLDNIYTLLAESAATTHD